jgi:hypothetical protein
MTLREAKKAYKRDGGGFRFTASQLARADRIDEQEAKRRKALDKEKQKLGNKRKREEKEQRENAVKRQMLEEGRISVEDTWGKVTSSQPRLNKFFVQRSMDANAPLPPRPSIITGSLQNGQRDVTRVTLEEHRIADAPLSEDKQQKAVEDLEQVAAPLLVQEQNRERALVSQTSLPHGSGTEAMTVTAVLHETNGKSRCQSTPLEEVWPSQINARLGQSCNFVSTAKEARRPSPRFSASLEPYSVSQAPRTTTTISNHEHLKQPLDRSPSTSATLQAKGPSALQSKEIRERRNRNALHGPAKNGLNDIVCPNTNNGRILSAPAPEDDDTEEDDTEEDFTDGIDDETFLMLCATQKPRKGESANESPHHSVATKPGPAGATVGGTYDAQAQKNGTGLTTALSESFSSVFGEIDEEDLVAVVKEFEAKQRAADEPTVAVSTGPNDSMGLTTSEELPSKILATSTHHLEKAQVPHVPAPTTKPMPTVMSLAFCTPKPSTAKLSRVPALSPTTMRKPPLPKRRLNKPTVCSWDDFDGIGPSTQATMLEVAKQVEAALQR